MRASNVCKYFNKMSNSLINSNEFEILVRNSHKLNSLCRICLTENTVKSSSLFEVHDCVSISEKVMRCTKITILDDDGLPRIICEQCIRELDAADSFRLKCEDSDALLRKFYLNCNLKNEEKDTSCEDFVVAANSWSPVKKEEYEGREAVLSEDRMDDTVPLTVVKKKKKIKTKKIKTSTKLLEETIIETTSDIKLEKEDLDDSYNLSDDPCQDACAESIDAPLKKKAVDKKYHCDLCGKPLSTKYSLEKHVTRMHSEGKMRAGHVSGFGRERRFHCSECPYSTPHSQSLKYHTRVHSGEKPYRCTECPRSFSQPGSLSCHRKTHSDRTYYTCAQCGKQFKYKETYETHKNVHSELKKFTCTICNKGLKSRSTLQGHMNRHYNIRNYNCETCGSTFVTRVELLNHSKKHSTEKKFQCNYCDFRTYVKKGLDSHLRRHSGERPFKCDACGMACYTRGELKCHMRKHTKEKNYSCPVCQLKFIHSSSVNKHMLKTHGIKYRRNDTLDRRIIK